MCFLALSVAGLTPLWMFPCTQLRRWYLNARIERAPHSTKFKNNKIIVYEFECIYYMRVKRKESCVGDFYCSASPIGHTQERDIFIINAIRAALHSFCADYYFCNTNVILFRKELKLNLTG